VHSSPPYRFTLLVVATLSADALSDAAAAARTAGWALELVPGPAALVEALERLNAVSAAAAAAVAAAVASSATAVASSAAAAVASSASSASADQRAALGAGGYAGGQCAEGQVPEAEAPAIRPPVDAMKSEGTASGAAPLSEGTASGAAPLSEGSTLRPEAAKPRGSPAVFGGIAGLAGPCDAAEGPAQVLGSERAGRSEDSSAPPATEKPPQASRAISGSVPDRVKSAAVPAEGPASAAAR
jgi:hypothetical protein